uniref:Uncharacterized protein n=1 Tax=viral metagenome TaxID=1070528 RepID=A0A6M3XSS0_9ZZZZ
MTKITRYYINDTEYSGLEIVKLARDFGWKGPVEKSLATETVIESAIKHLASKNMSIHTTMVVSTESHPKSSITPPPIRMIPKLLALPSKPVPVNNAIMTVYYTDAIYTVDTNLLGPECWDIQIFGSSICAQCPYRNKTTCHGKEATLSIKNSLNNEIPIARLISIRPRRENGKEERISVP